MAKLQNKRLLVAISQQNRHTDRVRERERKIEQETAKGREGMLCYCWMTVNPHDIVRRLFRINSVSCSADRNTMPITALANMNNDRNRATTTKKNRIEYNIHHSLGSVSHHRIHAMPYHHHHRHRSLHCHFARFAFVFCFNIIFTTLFFFGSGFTLCSIDKLM